jgi:hypothetical protein
MKKDSKKVEKLLDAFFAHSTVHQQPVLNIIKEMRSTYDGDYPYFELVYAANNYNNFLVRENIVESVTGYTGLREGRDYWLGVTWQYLED